MTAPSVANLDRGSNHLAPDRPRMQLLDWAPVGRGALVGRARIRLPSGLEITDVAVFQKDGRRWSQFPAEVMRDREGRPLVDANGKARYRSSIRWETRPLQDRFSDTLVALVLAAHPAAFNFGAS
jgi:hypothetical protein